MHQSILSNGHSSVQGKGTNDVIQNRRIASMWTETQQRLRQNYSKLRQSYLYRQLE